MMRLVVLTLQAGILDWPPCWLVCCMLGGCEYASKVVLAAFHTC